MKKPSEKDDAALWQVDEDKDAVNRWIVKALERGELQP